MARLLTLLFALCLSLPLSALNWNNDFEKAKVLAKTQNKPMLVYFSGKWCVWCVKLDNDFLNKPEFGVLEKELILVKLEYPSQTVDYTSEQTKLRKDFKVFNFPTLIVLSANAEFLGSIGYPRDSLAEYIAKIRSLAQIKMVQEKEQEASKEPPSAPLKKPPLNKREKLESKTEERASKAENKDSVLPDKKTKETQQKEPPSTQEAPSKSKNDASENTQISTKEALQRLK